ncbi:MAG TPA: MFS transporter [Proteus sp.]|uniref:Transport protein n=1 Tax=Proteus hauseri ATCC 700826 TaxID=1354271 RepID=A0AAJ3LTZ1_PROHU|nr:MFS transporter [Proteus hauseri]OAT46483.1 putative transport protein [Proteus hauseri ATCC 700826]QAV24647.1 MFS transporter [Proteus hauseri]HCH49566.1 MFS transporter [Proteus sp. (in: enterobacteria)]
MRLNFPLIALAMGAFAIGATEFSPMGMLPLIAQGLDISIPTAGIAVIAYATGVMIGAPIMTLLLNRYSVRKALTILMGLFTLGNILSGLSPDFISLLLSRIITSLNHGAFFGIGAVVAASVVLPHQRASAVAAMFMGLTLANIVGVPLMTWLGQTIGWRGAFLAIATLGVITIAALLFSLPTIASRKETNIRNELKALTKTPVLLALLTTVLGASAMFTLYTYIAPILINITDLAPERIIFMLVLIGIGFTLGNYWGGKAADKSLNKALISLFLLLIISMMVYPLVTKTEIGAGIALVIWGFAAFGLVPPIQTKVMLLSKDAPALASSVNIGAFNLGNAIGAAAGGVVLQMGLGYSMVPIAGGIIALLGLLLVLWQCRRECH